MWTQIPFQPGNEIGRLPIGARIEPGKDHLSKQVQKTPGFHSCQIFFGACPQMVDTCVLLTTQYSGSIKPEIRLPKAYISVYFQAIICRILALVPQLLRCLKKYVKMYSFLHEIRKKRSMFKAVKEKATVGESVPASSKKDIPVLMSFRCLEGRLSDTPVPDPRITRLFSQAPCSNIGGVPVQNEMLNRINPKTLS